MGEGEEAVVPLPSGTTFPACTTSDLRAAVRSLLTIVDSLDSETSPDVGYLKFTEDDKAAIEAARRLAG